MTVIEQIEHEVRAIPAGKRREALRLIRGLKATAKGKRAGKKTLGAAREAIGAAKGMWRGADGFAGGSCGGVGRAAAAGDGAEPRWLIFCSTQQYLLIYFRMTRAWVAIWAGCRTTPD